MNAPGEIVPGVARPPRKEDYFPIISGMRPFIKGEELELRASLMLMRDRAIATKNTTCEYAWPLLDVIERVACDHAMNHLVTVDDLRELRSLCLNVVMAASGFDAMFSPRLPLNEGEADESG